LGQKSEFVVVAFVGNISLSQSFCIFSKTSPMQMASSSYHPNMDDVAQYLIEQALH
jgi:hypothetical protein